MRGALLALGLSMWSAQAAGDVMLQGHGGPIMDVAVSADGTVATASFDNSVGLWTEGAPRWLDGHTAAVNAAIFLRDGRVASGGDDFAVVIWQPETGSFRRLEGHGGKVMALAEAPGGGVLASASWDGTIGVWSTAEDGVRFLQVGAAVNDLSFAPDGTLYSASADGVVRAWEPGLAGGNRVVARHGFGVNRLVPGPGWLAYGAVDGAVLLVSTDTGEMLEDFSAGRRPVLALSYAPLAGLLAVGDGEGHILLVDVARGDVLHDFRAMPNGPVWSLAFSPDESRIFAAGLDAKLYSWSIDALGDAVPVEEEAATFRADPSGMENGERQFARKCSICHMLQGGSARRAGPTLEGLFGRRAGTVPDYIYSERLAQGDIVWTDATIDALFEEGPEHYIPGSKMPMQRIAGARDRADLIDYLKSATEPGRDVQ